MTEVRRWTTNYHAAKESRFRSTATWVVIEYMEGSE